MPRINSGPRIKREQKTIAAMLYIFCAAKHGGAKHGDAARQRGAKDLCAECEALRAYAFKRLESCRYGEEKTTCVKCPTHCYQARQREQVKEVMRFSGPRMLWRHPWLALRHLLDER